MYTGLKERKELAYETDWYSPYSPGYDHDMHSRRCGRTSAGEAVYGRKTLLLNTHNVTIEGTAEFSLDHQAAFKKDAMNRLMNLGGQFLIRRLFGVDYDYDTYAGTRMEQYVTVTQGILGCTESFTLQNLELRVETDAEERISAVEGRLEVELSTYNDGKHTLEVTLNGHAGAYGQSYVGAFSPEAYGVRTEYELAALGAESVPEALSEPFVPEAKGSVVYSEARAFIWRKKTRKMQLV